MIGVGKAFGLPSLRTVQAIFPHTALQSMVSRSGLSRLPPGRVQGEQPGGREEFVWPAYPVIPAVAATGSFLLLAEHRPKPARTTIERRGYSRLHIVWLHAAGTRTR